MAKKNSIIWCYCAGRDEEVPFKKRHSGNDDRRHVETYCIIEKRCLWIDDRRHIKIGCKINFLVGEGEEPKESWEEWSQIYD